MAIGQGFFVGNSTSRAGVLLVTVPQLLKPLRLLKGFNSCIGNYISKNLAGGLVASYYYV